MEKIYKSIEISHLISFGTFISEFWTTIFYPIFTATFNDPNLFLSAIISWSVATFLICTVLAGTTEIHGCWIDSWSEKNFIKYF